MTAVPREDGSDDRRMVVRNRKARHEYHIDDTIEAGLVLTGTEVVAFEATDAGSLDAVELRGRESGAVTRHQAAGAFVFVGLDPNSGWLGGMVDTDERGFVTTDRTFATSVPGVFAGGDVRAGSTKQLASAVGEGAAAALQIRYHLDAVADGALVGVG